MTKSCIKKDLAQLEHDIDDLIMLEDSARGTLCAIHKTIHSTDNFPSSKHKMLKLCPVPRYCQHISRIPISRSRRKSRSNSPCDRGLSPRTNPHLRSCSAVSRYCKCGNENVSPVYHNSNYVNVEKTISCPGKMCCYSKSNRSCTITSRSSVQIDKFAQNLINTDEIVSELKGEIERVKHQLHHMSHSQNQGVTIKKRSPTPSPHPTTKPEEDTPQITKLKSENKRLKRELESKRRLLEKSKTDVEKAREILSDYEKKVGLLHVQAIKSSKTMKLSKERFCKCLKDKDDKIKSLKDSNEVLVETVKEKDSQINKMAKDLDSLSLAFEETCEKCSVLTESNQNFYESIEMLRGQLVNSATEMDMQRSSMKLLEQKLCDLNCACKKITTKTKKQKENYENQFKSFEEEKKEMSGQISELSAKLDQAGRHKTSVDHLQCKCEELESTLKEYEKFSEKCQCLEEECKKHYETIIKNDKDYQKDRKEMEKLIEQLTTVVKTNKAALLQMSEINKQQEMVIKTQSVALMSKEEQLKLIEKQSEEFKIKNELLAREVEELRKCVSEPCSKEACLCVSKELQEIRNNLNIEKDNHLLKEKIIQDQSQTILTLQSQVKEKMHELNRAQNDTKYLEEEIGKINNKLIEKHGELDKELDEKENLIEKLRILECQKNQLTEEIGDFEEMLQNFKETCGDNERQQKILRNLEKQIEDQRSEWDKQKNAMAKEKQKAVCAAKFATQKLLETVADFQRQVDAQKKVQLLLTKMLHEKDEQLRVVTSKISDINNITRDLHGDLELPMKELFFRGNIEKIVPSDPNTTTSFYSSCSSGGKKHEKFNEKSTKEKNCPDMSQIVSFLNNTVQRIQEEPSRDLS